MGRRGVALGAMLLFGAVAVGCADKFNRNVVEAFLLANEAQSAESMAALFHEDAVLVGPDGRRIEGREAIEGYSRWLVAVESRLSGEVVSSAENDVRLGPLTDENALLRGMGIDRLEFEPGTLFRLEGGLIREVKIAPMTENSGAELAAAMEELLTWAQEQRPDSIDALMDPMPALDTEYAELWLAAVADWPGAER